MKCAIISQTYRIQQIHESVTDCIMNPFVQSKIHFIEVLLYYKRDIQTNV